MKKSDYTKETLLDVLGSYARMIDRNGEEFPTVVLDDIRKSIESILKVNEYDGRYKDILKHDFEEICPLCDFEDGDFLYTTINGSKEDVRLYYIGKFFNCGIVEDKMKKCVDVEFLN